MQSECCARFLSLDFGFVLQVSYLTVLDWYIYLGILTTASILLFNTAFLCKVRTTKTLFADHFSRISHLHITPHAQCDALLHIGRAHWMRIVC